ncbi:hypothetical protein ACFQDD_01595 [Halorubrum pallidum]|uniref:Uncharacterized protein n=1 Tax=Halorubrum pallidum TaxID=1526114 RepID=A0ABD5SZ88_9EURY
MAHSESDTDETAVESRLVTDADELSEGELIHIEDKHWAARARVLSIGDSITDPINSSFELEIVASDGYDPENVTDCTGKPRGAFGWRIAGFKEDEDGDFTGWVDISDEAIIMRAEE